MMLCCLQVQEMNLNSRILLKYIKLNVSIPQQLTEDCLLLHTSYYTSYRPEVLYSVSTEFLADSE
uniref:Uncharacterized protein n=1 Tax=Anguilla anguilla TaxID=7936 RepID=A0A0E9SHY5_ANGAN